jgi:hypothetical protein
MGIQASSNPAREQLNQLSVALIRHHKTLLDSERAAYERDVEKIANPNRMLQLVLGDPYFAWLRRLSELIVEIDECADDKKRPPVAEDVPRFLSAARALLVPREGGSEFAAKYDQAMQRDPGVVIAHGQVVALLGSLEG